MHTRKEAQHTANKKRTFATQNGDEQGQKAIRFIAIKEAKKGTNVKKKHMIDGIGRNDLV
jgi:hypothetical protein